MRKSGLNIMMSMKDGGQAGVLHRGLRGAPSPSRGIHGAADGGVRAARHEGHLVRAASVGCLHVRPMLNLKLDKDLNAMRAIAEEAFALVREYKGSHSGEHGDGIVRSNSTSTSWVSAPTARGPEEVRREVRPGLPPACRHRSCGGRGMGRLGRRRITERPRWG